MTIYLNARDNPVTYNKKNYLLRAQKRMRDFRGYDFDIKHEDDPLFADISECSGEPDYILNIEPCDFKYGKIWSGFWHIDNLGIGDAHYYASYRLFDTVFTADLSTDPKAILLLQACDPELHRPMPELQKYDFVIAASHSHAQPIYDKRNAAYAELKKHFTYMDYGTGHKPEEYVKLLNSARVQFIHSMIVEDRGEIAQRFFECLAIGPVLTNWVAELDYTGLIEGKDYMSYKNLDEMQEKMGFLIAHDEERAAMARAGRTAALLYHSYENRLGSILNIIKYGA